MKGGAAYGDTTYSFSYDGIRLYRQEVIRPYSSDTITQASITNKMRMSTRIWPKPTSAAGSY